MLERESASCSVYMKIDGGNDVWCNAFDCHPSDMGYCIFVSPNTIRLGSYGQHLRYYKSAGCPTVPTQI